jgi:hypothetical protein
MWPETENGSSLRLPHGQDIEVAAAFFHVPLDCEPQQDGLQKLMTRVVLGSLPIGGAHHSP